MPELILLRGYSGSGKTTYAKRHIEGNPDFVRVNRDDIRRMKSGRSDKFVGTPKFEEQVTADQRAMIRNAIKAGQSVIVDDTNLRVKFARQLLEFGRSLGAEVDVINIRTSLVECLVRNGMRLDGVNPEVIRTQARKWPIEKWEPILLPVLEKPDLEQYVPDESLRPAITVDLDGTLAHMTGRNPYDESRYHEDDIDVPLREIVNTLAETFKVIIFTGRSSEYRAACEEWLYKHGVRYDVLLMRAEGDKRKDHVIKTEIFRDEIAPYYRHVIHIDDRDRVVDALRDIGVKVLQAQRGDF